MDEDEFWQGVRVIGLIAGGLLTACVVIYLIFVAGFATHAYINRIDPDPPVCVHDETCQDRYGGLVTCTKSYPSDGAGHPINLPAAPTPPDAGAK
jgi:hypothetical protein